MRFANWEFFFLLLLLIPAIYLTFWGHKGGKIRFSDLSALKKAGRGGRWYLLYIPFALEVLAFIFLVIALARPQFGHTLREMETNGIDIILALDTSGSMEARDLEFDTTKRTRLEVAKEVVANFVKNRPADRLGLVVFGEHAFTQCPLTLDHGVLLNFLDNIGIGHAGANATAIGDAVAIAVKRIKEIESKSKVVILLTDGQNNSGEIAPKRAAEIAATFGIKLYTVGVGTRGKAPFIEETIFGKRVRYEDVDIDEKTLTEMATLTGGRYFRATDTKSLTEIYKLIDQMEKVEIKVKEHMEYNERYVPFLITGLILLILSVILQNTLIRKVP